MYTLGLNAAFHDSSACLVHDGMVLAAAEEERFTRVKHAKRPIPFSTYELPFHAVAFCLRRAGITLKDVDHVAYAYDPTGKLGDHIGDASLTLPMEPSAHPVAAEWESPWDPLFLSSIVNAPRHLAAGAPHHLLEWFTGVTAQGPFQWHWVDHHEAHAASAFLPSPFDHAAVLTLDGRGERATTTYHVGEGHQLCRLGQVDMPHSLGLLYEELTTYLGFLHSSDEYKVMALASYGKPSFKRFFQDIVQVQGNGQYRIRSHRFDDIVGPPRRPGSPFEQRHYDLARSLQDVLQETALALTEWMHQASRSRHLCMAGGVALNCVMNAYLRDHGPFGSIWVQPAAGDAGTAMGAALMIDAAQRSPTGPRSFQMDHAFWGPSYGEEDIESVLRRAKLTFRRLVDVEGETAELLARDHILGWFQGAMEFGPRALGSRSILASPINPTMQDRLNDIKDREDFRPVAPVVLEEAAAQWFEGAAHSPFMLFTYQVRPDRANRIPAVRHVDGSARVQTVTRLQHPRYYDLIKAFEARTGVPVLVNTSFNTRGAPIVCTPREAVEAYSSSPLDALVIGPFLLTKNGRRP
ncbi:MAG: carbamoyltransferase [Nitrospira sp. SG-bin1]|nr:MAG: carbamoyltransferase [Nitrospira sp. SG-bin1]